MTTASKGTRTFEKKAEREQERLLAQHVELALFVSGITPKSIRAIETLKELCEKYLASRYTLKVIDIYREPKLAKENDVVAVPTLIRLQPGPRKMFIGDLSDSAPILKAIGIRKGLK